MQLIFNYFVLQLFSLCISATIFLRQFSQAALGASQPVYLLLFVRNLY